MQILFGFENSDEKSKFAPPCQLQNIIEVKIEEEPTLVSERVGILNIEKLYFMQHRGHKMILNCKL